ncbi:MAG TPA: TonB-dependent receptor [Bacteroidota bacterium]|nr:TonB-dependent receptor [Bacteroidota bacterium]
MPINIRIQQIPGKTMMKYFLCLFMAVFTVNGFAQEKFGSITGQVVDGSTQQPLVGVTIVLVDKPGSGTSTDVQGGFTLRQLAVGEYSLRASVIGYQQTVLTNVVVSTGRSTKVKIRMNEEAIEVGAVEVKADYFSNEGSISPVSTIGLNGAEVKRSPGSAMDMQRIVQNLPSVANSNDQSNELLVRGGAPDENLTVMDNIEIPTTNHYPNQFNSGGPINMVNVDLIEDIRFSSGGYPANFGDKLSSVMDISLREGDRERAFAGNAAMNMAGIGSVFEGGFADRKGSWIISARQSLLEFVDMVTGMSSIGLTAIPKYYDVQGKATYDFSPSQKLTLTGIFGNDKIMFEGKPDEVNTQKRFVTDSTGVENVDVHSQQFAVGATLRTLFGADGYSLFTVYMHGNRYDVDVNEDFMYRQYDGEGKVAAYRKLLSNSTYTNHSTERMAGVKYDMLYHLAPGHELSFGGRVLTTEKFLNDVAFNSDTIRFDFNHDGHWDALSTFDNGRVHKSLGFGDESKFGAYVSDKIGFSSRLSATVGVRYDYFTYSKKGNVSPRFDLSYQLTPMTTKLNFAYGEYYQTLSLPLYGDNLGTDKNRYLDNAHARHFVAGIEHIIDEGLKATLEAYYKEYDHLPVDEQFMHMADKTFRSDKQLSIGKRTSRGIELFIQQKQVGDFYGTLSVSYSSTRSSDPRLDLAGFAPVNEGTYVADYDFPLLVTLVAGKVVRGVRSSLDDMPAIVKYPSYILPFSDDMEVSFRFRYSSGRPSTPRVFTEYIQKREGGVTWSRGSWQPGTDINSERMPDYHRLDLQWLSRWHKESYNIVMIVALQNVYNRKNIAGYQYSSDGTKDEVYQFSFFPIVGLSVEF